MNRNLLRSAARPSPPTRSVTNPGVLIALLAAAGGAACAGATPDEGPCADPTAESCPGQQGPRPGGDTVRRSAPVVLDAADTCPGAAYLCAELDGKDRIPVHRWRDREGPLVVHVPRPQLADQGAALELQRAASAGVRLWNGRPFPILVDERGTRAAHIRVVWMEALDGAQLGRAMTLWTPARGLEVLAFELVTTHPHSRRTMEPDQVRLTAAHEMGHALGLPHSGDPRDVMYPTNTAVALSTRDYRAVEALYRLPDGAEIATSPPPPSHPPPNGTRTPR